MRGAVTLVALGAVLLLAGAGCGGSASAARHGQTVAFGHGILFMRSSANRLYAPIYLWKPGTGARRVGPSDVGVLSVEWSPDGKSIVWSGHIGGWDDTNFDHVYEMRADGTGLKRLTDDSNHDSAWLGEDGPSWTPDGRRIIYARSAAAENSGPLVLMTVDTQRKRVLRLPQPVGEPLWGPLGIAELSRSDSRTLTLFNPDTHRSRVFAHIEGPLGMLAWSRTGEAAVLEGPDAGWLAVYSRRGREVGRFRVPAAAHGVCGLDWSPDGKHLLVVARTYVPNEYRYSVWITDLQGGQWQRLPLLSLADCVTSWS